MLVRPVPSPHTTCTMLTLVTNLIGCRLVLKSGVVSGDSRLQVGMWFRVVNFIWKVIVGSAVLQQICAINALLFAGIAADIAGESQHRVSADDDANPYGGCKSDGESEQGVHASAGSRLASAGTRLASVFSSPRTWGSSWDSGSTSKSHSV